MKKVSTRLLGQREAASGGTGRIRDPDKLEMCHNIGDTKFQCSCCPTLLREPSQLMRHERMHGWEKPFSCLMCSNSFALIWDLRQHERGVHKIAGPKGGRIA